MPPFVVLHWDPWGIANVTGFQTYREARQRADLYVIGHGAELVDYTTTLPQ